MVVTLRTETTKMEENVITRGGRDGEGEGEGEGEVKDGRLNLHRLRGVTI